MLAGVNQEMTVAQEEIFGPVVTISPFDDEKDAVRMRTRPLRADVDRLDGRPARGHRLARQIKAGTVGINMPYTAFPGSRSAGTSSPASAVSSGSRRSSCTCETKSVIVSTSPKPFNPFGL